MSLHDFKWVSMISNESSWFQISLHDFKSVSMISNQSSWVSRISNESSWFQISLHNEAAMYQIFIGISSYERCSIQLVWVFFIIRTERFYEFWPIFKGVSNAKMLAEGRNTAMVTMVRISNVKNSQRFWESVMVKMVMISNAKHSDLEITLQVMKGSRRNPLTPVRWDHMWLKNDKIKIFQGGYLTNKFSKTKTASIEPHFSSVFSNSLWSILILSIIQVKILSSKTGRVIY